MSAHTERLKDALAGIPDCDAHTHKRVQRLSGGWPSANATRSITSAAGRVERRPLPPLCSRLMLRVKDEKLCVVTNADQLLAKNIEFKSART